VRRAAVPAAIAAAVTLLLAGCGGGDGEATPDQFTGVPLKLQDPGAIHVHGLGYDGKSKVLYLATHTGMFQLPDGAAKARRIGDNHQDTMGFTLVGPDMFLGSGHPDARAELPPHLGLIRSTDRGRTWTTVSLLGEADFHGLRSHGKTIYGYDSSNERLLTSSDSGRSWRKLTAPEALLDLAVDPSDPQHLLASGGSVLYRSVNGGRAWQPVASGLAGYLAWPSAKRIFVATLDGSILSAAVATGPWRSRGSLGAPVAALLAVSDRALFAALHDGTITASSDGGITWKARAQP
jgi:hypothetical protein